MRILLRVLGLLLAGVFFQGAPAAEETPVKPPEDRLSAIISLNFQDIGLTSALYLVADYADLNLLFGDAVRNRGSVSIRLKGVTGYHALESVTKAENLGFIQSGNVLFVDTPDKVTQIKNSLPADTAFSGRKISFSVNNLELRSLIAILAALLEKNIVSSGQIGGKVSIRLKEVPIDKALHVIALTSGFTMEQLESTLILSSPVKSTQEQSVTQDEEKQDGSRIIPPDQLLKHLDKDKAFGGTIESALPAGAEKTGTRPGCIRPEADREKQALELYPLDGLVMAGYFQIEHEPLEAIVIDPGEYSHRVTQGDYLGQNYGRVANVSDTAVDIVEWVDDGTGCYMERQNSLKISQEP